MRPCGAGYEKLKSGLRPLGNFVSATFFCSRETASQFLLSGTKKRHIQPERYVQVCPNIIW
jgi:hypothetical protein